MFKEMRQGDVTFIYLDQYSDKLRALVEPAIKIWIPYNAGSFFFFWQPEQILALQKILYCK